MTRPKGGECGPRHGGKFCRLRSARIRFVFVAGFVGRVCSITAAVALPFLDCWGGYTGIVFITNFWQLGGIHHFWTEQTNCESTESIFCTAPGFFLNPEI